jgi:hypothetical protein
MLKKVEAVDELSPLNAGFAQRVQALADNGKQLVASYADLSERMLEFASEFRGLWDEAKTLDKAENGMHHDLLRRELAEIVKSSKASVWSKWNTIGAQAQALLPYKASLPPQRECLYELAIAVRNKKPIDRWIENEQLTSTSTVREVASLRKTRKRNRREKQYLATVTLRFNQYGDAAKALKAVLLSSGDFKVPSGFRRSIEI